MTIDQRPNLLVIGAARSGTTSLWASLARHAQVLITDPDRYRAMFARPPLDGRTAATLAPEFEADVAAVEAALGHSIDDWRRP